MVVQNVSFMKALGDLDERLAQQVGHKYMTVLLYDSGADEAERVYSSNPQVFPDRGRKPMDQGPKMAFVRDTGLAYVAIDRFEIERDYPDHQKVFAMGCASLLNVPIKSPEGVIGQVNLMHDEYYYDHGKVKLALQLVSSFFNESPSVRSQGSAV
ncbi:hypothetical protein HU734_011440 [Pseudomonas wayambapalatensis]|uniref:hypothetical protein n=1 Tax=Pseudomonas sp. L7 TaxID=3388343 RepID=UPI00164553D6|nr:hypothetical protein [uncultured Pseudomonas sp.]QXI45327.1 hypothetical protein HU734_011440 [Pseudomonas wayambapalatensis]